MMISVICLAISAVLIAADQVIKYFVLLNLKPIGTFPVIPGLFELSYVENRGSAFGMMANHSWIIIGIVVLGCAFVGFLLFRYQHHTFFSRAAATLIIAGGIGNLIDRFLYGYVVDYLHVLFFDYVFNFADCCITVGAVLFVIHVLYVSHLEKKAQTLESPGKE